MREQYPNIRMIDGIKYKICTKCGELKLYDSEYFNLPRNRKTSACKKCLNVSREDRRKRDPEKYKLLLRDKKLRQKFGITIETLQQMTARQNNQCFICGGTNKNNIHPLGVDHNHETGQIRKLLCSQCNTALGHTKENYLTIIRLLWYLYIHNNNIEMTFDDFIKQDIIFTIIKTLPSE